MQKPTTKGEASMTAYRKNLHRTVTVMVVAALIFMFRLPQPSGAASIEDVAMMKGADRQKILVEGARKEGKLMWYTTRIVDQVVRPCREAFEKEYPFIQIKFIAANPRKSIG